MKRRQATTSAVPRWCLQESLERLVQLYEATARPAQAAEWKQKLAELQKALSATNPAAPPP